MDWKFTDDQESLRKLAAKAFAERGGKAPVAAAAHDARDGELNDGFDAEQWAELGRAGLIDLAIPTEHGGAGLGLVELCLVLEQQGRAVSDAPLLPSLLAGALTVAAFGTAEQQARLLPPVARGESLLSAAFSEPAFDAPTCPRTLARRDGDGFRLDGVKTAVPIAGRAARVLVPARIVSDGSEGGVAGYTVGLFLLDPRAEGVTLERQLGTDDRPTFQLTLSSARVDGRDLLGGALDGARIVEWTEARVGAGLCAMALGVAARQLEMTSEYVMRRQQFGKPIGLFQAVAQRCADAYVDVESIRLSTWQAVWRLAEGLSAERELSVARYFATEAGQRVSYAAQHLHGGMGFDRAFPLHRYFLRAKQIELTLGGANRQLALLGARIAEQAKHGVA